MNSFHWNLFVSIFIIFCSSHWSVGVNDTSVQPLHDHLDQYSTSTSSINFLNSVHNQSNISTKSPSILTNNSDPSNSLKIESSSSSNVTSFASNLSTTTTTTTTSINLTTLINETSSSSTINSTIISSQSLSTNPDQRESIDKRPQLIPISFDVAIYGLGLVLTTLLLISGIYGCVKVYHSRYPARITFGRKFSTFENPIYVQKDTSSGDLDGSRDNPATEIEDGPKIEPKFVQLI